VSSSTSSSRRWLQIFFGILCPVYFGYLAASEWLFRTEVLAHDNFEFISSRLRNSTQANAAFGDSHVAAVPDYNTKDFVNLGIGATTIRKMDQRVRYYFRERKPGEVIIQADPHLFAEYRLQPRGEYVPENYTAARLRVLDPQHRGFMTSYWLAYLKKGQLQQRENTGYDQLWQEAYKLQAPPASNSQAETPSPKSQSGVSPALEANNTSQAGVPASQPIQAVKASTTDQPTESESQVLAKFNAFMDYEVTTHTPVTDFRSRDEARIYRNLIKFLISRGAKVCLVNYPVDPYYRERADATPMFAQTREFYKEVAGENHIPYVSFWDRFNDASMFQNTDHVNQNGSPILAREAREACFGASR
jgi:hypothetical protein